MIIDNKLIKPLIVKAANSVRKRINYNFHKRNDDPMQRMLNILQPGTYVQPHKHENPDKREAFIILKGRLLIILFDEQGKQTQRCTLDHATQTFGMEIEAGVYHTIIALEKDTCIYELKDGPYDPDDDKNFAPWAPTEADNEATQYLNKLTIG